jgi:DNA-binding CsgD family transcriptional regulator
MRILAVILVSCAMTLYQNGKALREEGKQVEAMQTFIEAAHSGTEDEALLGRVYSNMANMCRQANDHETAYEVYEMSATHFGKTDDSLAYAYALNNMAWEQAAMGRKEEALKLVDSALSLQLSAVSLQALRAKVIETKAAACFFREEYDSVLYYTSGADNDYLLMLRAQAYSYLQVDDSAMYYAEQLLPRMTNLFYRDDLYYIVTHHDADADAEQIRRLSSERADVKKQIAERHGELMKAVQLLKQDLSKKEQAVPWKALLLGVIGIGLLIWGAVVVRKQRKLWIEKSDFEQARRKELAQNIRQLQEAKDIRQELAWDDFAALCLQIDKRFHGLASTLQAQELNEQDVRICVLVLIGLSHKEIAEILNCSPKSIGKLKDLTAKKLGVSGGQLQEKLQNIAIL